MLSLFIGGGVLYSANFNTQHLSEDEQIFICSEVAKMPPLSISPALFQFEDAIESAFHYCKDSARGSA